jgi:hypothetical protein
MARPPHRRSDAGSDREPTLGRPGPALVSVRVDRRTAEALGRLPDRSAFLRAALVEATALRACAACEGRGYVTAAAAAKVQAFVATKLRARCRCCGFGFPPKLSDTGSSFACDACRRHGEPSGGCPFRLA